MHLAPKSMMEAEICSMQCILAPKPTLPAIEYSTLKPLPAKVVFLVPS